MNLVPKENLPRITFASAGGLSHCKSVRMETAEAGPAAGRSHGADTHPKTGDNVNPAALEDAPDPDEDDLDDLDEMLDDFSLSKPAQESKSEKPAAEPTTSTKTPPAASTSSADLPSAAQDEVSEEDFQRQLQAGMAELMGGLGDSSEMQAQFENIFKELGAAVKEGADSGPSQAAPAASAASAAAELGRDASFQETIKRTMTRMQESGDQATAAAAAAEGSEDDFLAEMMKALKDMPEGDGNEEDFSKMLMGLMDQLTNKEILYEPMKDLNAKFPGWMDKNKDTLASEDRKRFEEQQTLVAEMVAKFEGSTYSDSSVADREYIVARMQKMQAAGSPPPDLLAEMPAAEEVLEAGDGSCATQ